jgi:hypothetical protein
VHGGGLHTGVNDADPFSLQGKKAGNIGGDVGFARTTTEGVKGEDFCHAELCLLVDWVD